MFTNPLFYTTIAVIFLSISVIYLSLKLNKTKKEKKEEEKNTEDEEHKETKPKITIPPELSEIKILIEHTKKKKALIDTKAQEIQHLLTYLLKKNQFLIENKKNNLDLEEHEIDTSLIDFLE